MEKGEKTKNKKKKGGTKLIDKFTNLMIKLIQFLLKLILQLILGLIWGVLGLLERVYDMVSTFILKLPKSAKMVLLYIIIALVIFAVVYKKDVINYIGFNTIENNNIVYVDVNDDVCKLDELSCKIYFTSRAYDLTKEQSLMIVAISLQETGKYKYLGFNNFGGNFKSGSLMKFDTQAEGINYMVKNLKYGYFDKGLDTLEKIQKVYAPVGASNDKKENLNVNWLPCVSKYYKELLEVE